LVSQKEPNCKIGFDDRLITILMIPLVSFIIPIVFSGLRFQREPQYTWNIYFSTLCVTTVIWLGNRAIMIWARNQYPLFGEIKKRLVIQAIVMLVFTLLANNIIGYFLNSYCELAIEKAMGRTLTDVIINTNTSAIFCTLTIVAIYESKHFMFELSESIREKEMLKRESLQAQLNALKTQVNPHFLFNNLNTLCSIIPENPKQAVDFVQELSKVYRYILEVKDEKSISVRDEIKVLQAYAFLLKTRFGNNFNLDISITEQEMEYKIVPFSLQLLVENAIKHNVVSADKPLKIFVHTEDGNLLVSNNLQKKNQIVESTGIGLNNIRNRYKLLTDKLVAVKETALQFTVSIPLIANS
jgi:LytS/YehU family sensor histidine kinase